MHVFDVFNVYGYTRKPFDQSVDWDVIWAHEYPFKTYADRIKFSALKPHQKVNHFPGIGFITNKIDLATSNIKYVPPAFHMPKEQSKFFEFVSRYECIYVYKFLHLQAYLVMLYLICLNISK